MIPFLVLFLWSVELFVSGVASTPNNLPAFELDFDEHPATRYNAVFKHYRSQIIEMENYMMHSIAPVYRDIFMNNTNQFLISNPEAYYSMSSLANITDLPLWQTLLVNSVVDITSFCTSVVGVMSNGTVIHGRNLDFDFPTVLQSLVYRAYIRYKKQVIGEGICIAGYIGFYTAIRYNAFSVSFNVRMYPHTNTSEIAANIMRELEPGVLPAAQAIEAALLRNSTFTDANAFLQSQSITTPCYLILAGLSSSKQGKEEGIVITRDPFGVNRTDQFDLSTNTWYLAQGNLDWWTTADSRYNATVSYLELLGRNQLTMETLVTDVLNKTGVIQLITIFTGSMSVEVGKLDVYLTPLN
jgi:hypothetical protein